MARGFVGFLLPTSSKSEPSRNFFPLNLSLLVPQGLLNPFFQYLISFFFFFFKNSWQSPSKRTAGVSEKRKILFFQSFQLFGPSEGSSVLSNPHRQKMSHIISQMTQLSALMRWPVKIQPFNCSLALSHHLEHILLAEIHSWSVHYKTTRQVFHWA